MERPVAEGTEDQAAGQRLLLRAAELRREGEQVTAGLCQRWRFAVRLAEQRLHVVDRPSLARTADPGCGQKRQLLRLKEDERIWCATCKEGFEKPGCERVEVETDGENPQHAGVLNAFAAHIQTGAPLVADGREGINGLMLSNAIHLSSWLGETVTLPIDEKKFLNLLNERRAHSRLKEDTDVVMDTASSYGGGAK